MRDTTVIEMTEIQRGRDGRDKTVADMDERYNVAEMAEIQRGRDG